MNFSCFSLQTSHILGSPFFTKFRSPFTKYAFKNILASNFTTNFIKTGNTKLNFHSSTFKNFLDTAVSVDTAHEAKGIMHDERLFNNPQDMSIETHTIFVKCTFLTILNLKKGAAGGGLYYTAESGIIDIQRCRFQWCFAIQRAGAFFLACKKSTVSSACILQCSAARSVQAFTITTNTNKARANVTSSILTSCGPLQVKNEKEQVRFETVSLDFLNTNLTENRRLQSGFLNLLYLYDAAINYCEFSYNAGPHMFTVSKSYDIYIAFCNIVGNNLGNQPIIISTSSSVYVTFSFFQKNKNVNNASTFSVDQESDMKIIFGNCTFDAPEGEIVFNPLLVQVRKCLFNLTVEGEMNTFQTTRDCEFYYFPSRTTPPRTPTKKKTHIVNYIPEPTIDWYPQILVKQQKILYITICIAVPILIYAFFTKKRVMEIQALEGN